ncbi:CCA tRNA nucleotidyltransferase [Salipiger marinus]|uniref:CCA tRNA nucleotidyltransferase n=1 Tax=Salipiger marinus TaxID=555512 RepID=UPI001E58507D|nr:CCA tRNA nucleotidyltransferase [Salipiger manganoxidans]MCD1617345.1 CCA tRNA nucleotidyltransferase [Salipiger manganoxidans]MEB3417399.1 CCA tRNA nucleotidyltransferase [Salipiger manganoxidans]
MKVSGDWLTRPATQTVLQMLEAGGVQAFVVGGCVRNALMGVAVGDVDIATAAPPDRVMELAQEAGLKAIPTGIDHGTVTVVADGIGHEITTFRADTETDGRRAVVRFSSSLAEDAARRDFTMNALYADARGQVADPLGGLPDLVARRVRFIGAPLDRIREDYLRILRYFRFAAWYGDPDQGFDADALDGIARGLDGMAQLSRERVGQELLRLLAAPDPLAAVSVMAQTGVLAQVLPGGSALSLGPLLAEEARLGLAPDALRRLAVLGADSPDLRLSRAQATRLALLQRLTGSAERAAELGWRHGRDTARDVLALRAASLQQPVSEADLRAAEMGAAAKFPLTARDLMPRLQGAALGAALRAAEARWIASGFTLTRAQLLDDLHD